MNAQVVLTQYINDLNTVVQNREFGPFLEKHFDEGCTLSFQHDMHGKQAAIQTWKDIIPPGRVQVYVYPYKLEGNRIFATREVKVAQSPVSLWGHQETEYDDAGRMTETIVNSYKDCPVVQKVDGVEKTRLGRITAVLADVFNEAFTDRDFSRLDEWLVPSVHVKLDSSFWGKRACLGPHHRIAPTARFKLIEMMPEGETRCVAKVQFTGWWESRDGVATWKLDMAPDGKLREIHISFPTFES